MTTKQKVIIVGAGPVGSLAALYAARRGHEVEVYELRDDLRKAETNPLNFTRSVNLALSERGISGLRKADHKGLLDHVMASTIPMEGRMIHGRTPSGELSSTPQVCDAHGGTIYAIDRAGLNSRLLDILDGMPNVTIFFQHKLTGADFNAQKAWFEVGQTSKRSGRAKEIQVTFDLMIGADGAHSAVRYHMMKCVRMDYHQQYIDSLWCEFRMEGKGEEKKEHRISPNHLHIWPGKELMFIAIPSTDGSFTCTLFMPSSSFAALDARDPTSIPAFFDTHFPGVTKLITPNQLISSYLNNPHLPLISIKCGPYHFSSSAVIIGDAAHAMVPFYGQGMNAGFEDVRILFDILDKHSLRENNNPYAVNDEDEGWAATQRASALAEYTALRTRDAHAINDLALENFVEMRAGVLSRMYRLGKWLEEGMSVYFPGLGWQTRYARVSFGNEPYSEIIERTEYQGKMLVRGFLGVVGLPVLAGSAMVLYRYRRILNTAWRGFLGFMGRNIGQSAWSVPWWEGIWERQSLPMR